MKKMILNSVKSALFTAVIVLVSCNEDEPVAKDPVVDFSYEIDEENPLLVSFEVSAENALGFSWDFGDGSAKDTTQNPTHEYAQSGSYEVTVTAIGESSNTTATKTVDVVGLPSPSFTYTLDEENPLIVTFTNTSEDASTYSWDFGDDKGTSTETSPSYTYAEAGDYTVTLTASGVGGEGTFTEVVSVGEYVEPAVNFLKGGEMNAEDEGEWSFLHYKSAQPTITFDGQLSLTADVSVNSMLYQVVDLEVGQYVFNTYISASSIVNSWMEFYIIPGDEVPASDPGATNRYIGWTTWCGEADGDGNVSVDGYIADVECADGDPGHGLEGAVEITESGLYIIGIKFGMSSNGGVWGSPIVVDDMSLVKAE